MKLKTPEKLETERLIIRRMINDDFEPFYHFMSNPEATKYLLFTPDQKTKEAVKQLLDAVIQSYETENEIFALTIENKTNGLYVGSLGSAPIENNQGFEIFYTLLPEYWGKGYALESSKCLLDYLQKILSINDIYAFCGEENTSAQKVAEQLGMLNQGTIIREGNKGIKFRYEGK